LFVSFSFFNEIVVLNSTLWAANPKMINSRKFKIDFACALEKRKEL